MNLKNFIKKQDLVWKKLPFARDEGMFRIWKMLQRKTDFVIVKGFTGGKNRLCFYMPDSFIVKTMSISILEGEGQFF